MLARERSRGSPTVQVRATSAEQWGLTVTENSVSGQSGSSAASATLVALAALLYRRASRPTTLHSRNRGGREAVRIPEQEAAVNRSSNRLLAATVGLAILLITGGCRSSLSLSLSLSLSCVCASCTALQAHSFVPPFLHLFCSAVAACCTARLPPCLQASSPGRSA